MDKISCVVPWKHGSLSPTQRCNTILVDIAQKVLND